MCTFAVAFARMAKLVNVAVSEAVVAILESSSLSSGTEAHTIENQLYALFFIYRNIYI